MAVSLLSVLAIWLAAPRKVRAVAGQMHRVAPGEARAGGARSAMIAAKSSAALPRREAGDRSGMTDKTTIQTNVDTFNDGGSYFVRTEIEARSVNIHGPFPDLQTAQKLQADQTASLKQTSEALREQLRRATTSGG